MKYQLIPPPGVKARVVRIPSYKGKISLLIVSPRKKKTNVPGILWIHGGGYILGMKEMVFMSRAIDLVTKYGAVVISPGYRLAWNRPYPAAIEDCYAGLLYLKEHAKDLGVNPDQLMIGGESAGGGLCASLAILARDKGEIHIAYQMPLCPMLDNFDTSSSRNNHGKVWNTRRNHLGWRMYLRTSAKAHVSPYASAARERHHKGLPPLYTFVADGEPFYRETLDYIDALRAAGVPCQYDVYHTDTHAFDMLYPEWEISKNAKEAFEKHFEYAMEHYFAENS